MKTSHQGIWLTIKRTAIVTAVLGALLVLAPGARAGGNVTFGIEAGYNTRYETPVAGLAFTYRLKPHFRLGADADIAFRHKDYDALLLMLTPKISCSKSSGVTSPQCSVIKGPVAKGLA